jgi:hypothetical protein
MSSDRIANPWGERTPFAAGQDWPPRVDMMLEDGLRESVVERSRPLPHGVRVRHGLALVGQAAQGLRDHDLLDVVRTCETETAIQLKWLRTRMKQAAPQALVVSE